MNADDAALEMVCSADTLQLVVQAAVFFWFSRDAANALAHYRKVFPHSELSELTGGNDDDFMTATLEIGGIRLTIFNGEPYGQFPFTEAASVYLTCEDQDEVDQIWAGLSDGGAPGSCGWVKDRFGLWWQVVPRRFGELMASDDPDVRERVYGAMRTMGKFDVAALERAARA